MKVRLLVLIGIALLGAAMLPFLKSRPSATAIDWKFDARLAFEQASASDRSLLVYLNADWCGYCRRLEQTTFVDPDVISGLADEFVWLNLNAEKDPEGIRLREKFGVEGFPVVLVLTPEEAEVDRVSGYRPPADFLQAVTAAATSSDSFSGLRRQAAEDSSSADVYFRLAQKYIERGMTNEAEDSLRRVPELDPKGELGHTDTALFLLARIVSSSRRTEEAFSFLDTLQAGFPESEYIPDSQVVRAQALLYDGKKEEAMEILAKFVEEHPDHELVPRIRMLMGL